MLNEAQGGVNRISATEGLQGVVASTMSPMRYELCTDPGPGLTYFGGVMFDSVDVFYYEGMGVRRTNRHVDHIRADHINRYFLAIPVNANIDVLQSEISADVDPGSCVLFRTDRPFDIVVSAVNPGNHYSCLHVGIPESMLRKKIPYIEQCCVRSVRLREGSGHILRSMIDVAVAEAKHLSLERARHFSSMLTDVIAHVFEDAPEVTDKGHCISHSSYARVVREAKHCIETNLSNPALDSEFIAQHCRISSRYLRAAFEADATTIASYIRELRLQQCRNALRAPALSNRTIWEIAVSWCFEDQSYFSRAYKARFGKSPREDRLQSEFS